MFLADPIDGGDRGVVQASLLHFPLGLCFVDLLFCESVGRGVWRMSCFLCASKLRGMADILEEKKSSSTSFGAAAAAVSSSSISDFDLRDVLPPRTFLDARSEQVSSVDLETLDVADPKQLTTVRQKLLEIGIDGNVWLGNTMV